MSTSAPAKTLCGIPGQERWSSSLSASRQDLAASSLVCERLSTVGSVSIDTEAQLRLSHFLGIGDTRSEYTTSHDSALANPCRYDWVAGPGDYVVENPGTIHTLFMGAGAEVVFTITGSLEFFNDDDSLRETMDIFSFAELYYNHCEEKGVKPNEKLWY
jgi:hypothetical protein